ncbi:NmrA-like family protein [Lentzea albidocapillata subsp. violacea]|uniref:NmrA-like family protein n=1 Tax=Lentzea albidocapillata subsp. violacea TaxID=128104 RepID=A0A1G9TJL2_9PSEU|nr:NmrA family NAD(P)-binding protein [Lentzea albidocapillata]SDM47823.1 NmrA-like family protein [Lentzea albidocapillata subsp. violacea]
MIAAVLGATGKQGGAVARHLVAAGWDVRAVTRNPEVPGGTVADQDSPESLAQAFSGADAVFSVQPAPHDPRAPQGYSPATETRWGRNVADAALAAGVAHLVYASLVEAVEETGVASFDSKWEVERHIADIGLPATVLRPTTFMDGLYAPGLPKLTHLLHPSVRYHLVAVDDIGAIAARVIADPDRFIGSSLTLAGDLLTPVEIAGLMGLEYEQFQVDDPELRKVFTSDAEPDVDIEALRSLHPGLRTFAEFLEDTGRRADRRVHGR